MSMSPHKSPFLDPTAQFLNLSKDDASPVSDSHKENPESDLVNQNANLIRSRDRA